MRKMSTLTMLSEKVFALRSTLQVTVVVVPDVHAEFGVLTVQSTAKVLATAAKKRASLSMMTGI